MPAKKITAKKKPVSGSQKMLAARGAKAPTGNKLVAFFDSLKKNSVIDSVNTKGTPLPDAFKISLTAKRNKEIASIIEQLSGFKGVTFKPVKILINGTPFPDIFKTVIEGKITQL